MTSAAHPSEEEVQMYLSQALYQQATGLTQTTLDTVAKITKLDDLDPIELKSIAAVQYQGSDYQAVLKTLESQSDLMSLLLMGKAKFGLGEFQEAYKVFNHCKIEVL